MSSPCASRLRTFLASGTATPLGFLQVPFPLGGEGLWPRICRDGRGRGVLKRDTETLAGGTCADLVLACNAVGETGHGRGLRWAYLTAVGILIQRVSLHHKGCGDKEQTDTAEPHGGWPVAVVGTGSGESEGLFEEMCLFCGQTVEAAPLCATRKAAGPTKRSSQSFPKHRALASPTPPGPREWTRVVQDVLCSDVHVRRGPLAGLKTFSARATLFSGG